MFKHPLVGILYAPSQGGKSQLTRDIILHREKLFDVKFSRIIYYYTKYHSIFSTIKDVEFIEGAPGEFFPDGKSKLIILDDQINNKDAINGLINIAIRDSHACSLTVLVLVQSIFHTRAFRSVSLNGKLFILFKHLRDKFALNTLFSQLSFNTAFLKQVHQHATAKPYKYLCINLQESCPELLRFSSDITSEYPVFYVAEETDDKEPILIKKNE